MNFFILLFQFSYQFSVRIFYNSWLILPVKIKLSFFHFLLGYEPFADTGKWQIIIFSKNCLRRLTGPYHPQ